MDVRIGLAVDGARAALATLNDGTVAATEFFEADSPERALRQALATLRRGDVVTASFSAEGLSMARLEVTAADLRSRAALEDRARDASRAPREGTAVALRLPSTDEVAAGVLTGIATSTAPAELVTALYEQLPAGSRVVPAPFTHARVEGVSLFLGYSTASVSLAREGRVLAHRNLPAGGLDAVLAVLGGASAGAPARLQQVMGARGTHDPLAERALETHLRALSATLRDTIETWARAGQVVADDVYVFGPGANARALQISLRDFGFGVRAERLVDDALVHLDPTKRPLAVAAYLAALAADDEGSYPDPAVVADAARRHAARARRRRTLHIGGPLLLLASAALGPGALASLEHWQAEQAVGSARQQLLTAPGAERVEGATTSLQHAQQQRESNAWAEQLTALTRQVGNADRLRVRAVDDGAEGALEVPVGNVDLTALLARLNAMPGIRADLAAVSRGADGQARATLTVHLRGSDHR